MSVSLLLARVFFIISLLTLSSFIYYSFINEDLVLFFLGILFGLVSYVRYIYYTKIHSIQRDMLEHFIEIITIFLLFLFPLLIFGFKISGNDTLATTVIIAFLVMQCINFMRNWSNKVIHTKGFPILLHGLFFPFTYFISLFYFQDFQKSVFIFYFLLTGILSLTSYNFLKFQMAFFEFENMEQNEKGNIQKDENKIVLSQEDEEILQSIPKLVDSQEFDNSKEVEKKDEGEVKNKNNKEIVNLDGIEYELDIDSEDENFLNSLSKL